MALKKSQLYASLWQSCDQLRGGMDAYWQVFPSLRKALFKRINGRRGYSALRVEGSKVKAAILGHEEFQGAGRADKGVG